MEVQPLELLLDIEALYDGEAKYLTLTYNLRDLLVTVT